LPWHIIGILEPNYPKTVIEVAVLVEFLELVIIQTCIDHFVEFSVNMLIIKFPFDCLLPELVLCLILMDVLVYLPFFRALCFWSSIGDRLLCLVAILFFLLSPVVIEEFEESVGPFIALFSFFKH